MNIIQEIEKRQAERRFKIIDRFPDNIRLQTLRIEQEVFKHWNLGTEMTGQIRLDAIKACSESKLNLDLLEAVIQKQGKEIAAKWKWEKALIKIMALANRNKL